MISHSEIKEMNKIIEGEWEADYSEYKITLKNIHSNVEIRFEDINKNQIWICVIKKVYSKKHTSKCLGEFWVSTFSDVNDVENTGNKWWYLGYIMFYDPPESCM